MENAMLKLEERLAIGGGEVKRLRKSGYVPAVVYGKGMEPKAVKVKMSDFREFLTKYGKNTVFSAKFGQDADFSGLVKDIQYDAVKNDFIHVDFQKVSLNEKIHVDVPVKVLGREKVEKGGGVIVHQLNEVTVACLPQDVPKHVDADITGFEPGDSITAAQLKLPPGVTLLTEPHDVILSITSGKMTLEVEKEDEPVFPVGEEGNVQAVKAEKE